MRGRVYRRDYSPKTCRSCLSSVPKRNGQDKPSVYPIEQEIRYNIDLSNLAKSVIRIDIYRVPVYF